MKKKMKRYENGGDIKFESKQGENPGIDEDVRARAKAYVTGDDSPAGKSGYGEENELPDVATTRISKPSAKPAATRPSKAEPKAEPKAVSNKPASPISSAREKTGFEKKKEAFMNRPNAEPSITKTTETKKSPSFSDFKEAIRKTFSFPKSQRTVAAEKSKGMKAGGKVSSASSRGDGIAQRGKTKGRMV